MARKILLADDSVTAQNMGRKILADAGYEVITVNNGSAALKRIAEAKPDLIVLDVYMPGYSGLEVCQRLKDSNDTARIPILLTVGKLEPFKPEEARRVRAEGFIVKPFEASELLSALTKLEDKIVPRSDSSKPGRFARAIAAVEESRYDKTVAIDEDSGWKNRISFPKKKKEKPAESEDGDDPAIYNAVNRDLKTVVEHQPAHQPEHTPAPPAAQTSAPQEQEHVDLGALAAHGLPKDVTPEEIAALAAAAAQVQGIAKSTSSEAINSAAVIVPETQREESKTEASRSRTEAATSEEIKPEASSGKPANAPIVQTAELPVVAPAETNTEDAPKIEATQEPTGEPASSSEKISSEPSATFASEKLQQKEETEPETRTPDVDREETISSAVDTPAAIASFATGDSAASSANGSSVQAMPSAEPESVTVAVAAVAATPSRWTAVAVALAPEESAVALEEEMRKAEAAVAVATPFAEPAPAPVETRSTAEASAPTDKTPISEMFPVEPSAGAPAASMSSAPEYELQEPPVTAAPATPVVKDFESVSPREPEPSPAIAEAAVESGSPAEPVATESAEMSIAFSRNAENTTDTKLEESVSTPVIESAAEPASLPAAEEPTGSEEAGPVPSEVVAALAEQEIPADRQEPEATKSAEIFAELPDSHISQENMEAAAVAAKQEISGGFSDMAKKESEIAASTAAAWASWRRIRENDGNGGESGSSPRDEAAMAVAAGAEKAPEEVSEDAEVSPEIASIVDSVLANLRPKIVEEISRKLGKKK